MPKLSVYIEIDHFTNAAANGFSSIDEYIG